MRRRNFIQQTAILGVGLTALPMVDLSANPAMEVIPLRTAPQIRHGLLSLNSVVHKDWIASLQKNIFYKNGHSPSKDDLLTYSFVHKNKAYLIGQKQQQITLSVDSKTAIASLEKVTTFQDNSIKVCLIGTDQRVVVNKQAVLLPLSDKTIVNHYELKEQFLWLSKGTYTVQTNQPVLSLEVL